MLIIQPPMFPGYIYIENWFEKSQLNKIKNMIASRKIKPSTEKNVYHIGYDPILKKQSQNRFTEFFEDMIDIGDLYSCYDSDNDEEAIELGITSGNHDFTDIDFNQLTIIILEKDQTIEINNYFDIFGNTIAYIPVCDNKTKETNTFGEPIQIDYKFCFVNKNDNDKQNFTVSSKTLVITNKEINPDWKLTITNNNESKCYLLIFRTH